MRNKSKIIGIILLSFLIFSCEKEEDKDSYNCIKNYEISFPQKLHHYIPEKTLINSNIVIEDSLLINFSNEFKKFNIYYKNDTIIIKTEICQKDGIYPLVVLEKYFKTSISFKYEGEYKLFTIDTNNSLSFIKKIIVE